MSRDRVNSEVVRYAVPEGSVWKVESRQGVEGRCHRGWAEAPAAIVRGQQPNICLGSVRVREASVDGVERPIWPGPEKYIGVRRSISRGTADHHWCREMRSHVLGH